MCIRDSLWAPPLHFRRRPPQSNCPPDTVLRPDHGSRLEPKSNKGGISTLAPPRLAPQLLSLPPILHKLNSNPISGCLSLIHISEPTRLLSISYAVFCLKKKKKG